MGDGTSQKTDQPVTLDPVRPTHPVLLRADQTDTGYQLHLRVPEELAYLDGHFPHVPIVAGVCQLKWVIDYIEEYTGQPLNIVTMEAVKFQRPLFPPQTFVIEFAFDEQAIAWQYRVFAETKQFSSGRLLIKP